MLRNGAIVHTCTRFAKDALLRYSCEKDFEDWKDRLHIYSLDFRDVSAVMSFCHYLKEKLERLDILINNAAQSVRRDISFY